MYAGGDEGGYSGTVAGNRGVAARGHRASITCKRWMNFPCETLPFFWLHQCPVLNVAFNMEKKWCYVKRNLYYGSG